MKKKIKPEPRKIKEVKRIIKALNDVYSKNWIEEVDSSKTPPFYGVWTKNGKYCFVCRNIGIDLDYLKHFINTVLEMSFVKVISITDKATLQHRQFDIKSHQSIPSRKFTDSKSADRAYQAALMFVNGFEKNIKVLASEFKVKQTEVLRQVKRVK